jgi:L-alanine-DL-glutamate epimerase-like enolase superfamily enzyme
MEHEAWIAPLRLRYPFGIARGSARELPTVLLRLGPGHDGGLGEAAPVRYLGHRAEDLRAAVSAICAGLRSPDLEDRSGIPADAPAPARAAVDIALWDRAARARDRPLHAELAARLTPLAAGATQTSYTIALDELDAMARRAAEAAHLPRLKLKLGRDPAFDREALRRVAAAAPRSRLRVDANGGWSLAQARELLPALCDHDVEFIEQPLARGQLAALAELRADCSLPIYADEDVQGPESLLALRGRVDGINLKLMKCGGISPALTMIAAARREGWSVLLGCMIESRVGLAAAAGLAGHVDEVDLDAHMLTEDDPVPPGSQRSLSAALPTLSGAGLGIPLRW